MNAANVGPGFPTLDPARADEFRAYLEQLLSQPVFAASRRRCQLLRYLVERNLAGESGQVTEYAIGLDVFQKPVSFDPRQEATVRVEMSRLRRALSEHYENAGASDSWRIQLPSRGYTPIVQPVPAPPVESPKPPAPAPAPLSRFRSKAWVAVLALAVLTPLAIVILRQVFSARPIIRSVVVLPFANLTGQPSNEYLADGVTEQLTDSLAQIPSLRVVARTSAFQFKGKAADIRDIGRRVDADAVVEGSLRYREGKIRLTVQVNRSADGYHILSRTFDGGMQELARLESDMVPPILTALGSGATAMKHRTPNPEAYDLFLKARALRGRGTKDSFDQAVAYLDQAIERDPSYADAYAALASVYASGAVDHVSEPLEYAKRARTAAARALELDPQSAQAYGVEGFVDSMVLLEWKKGEQELRKAISLMPQNSVSHNRLGVILMVQGEFPEAIAELRVAENLDPLPGGAGVTIGLAYYMARQYDTALRQFEMVHRLHPDLAAAHSFIGSAWQELGQFDKAMAEYRLIPHDTPEAANARMAHLFAVMGKQAEARKLVAEMEHPKPDEQPPNAFDLAAIHAALGDRDAAFRWLDLAYKRRIVWFLKVHPAFDPIRSDPRFTELLKKAGFAN